ncbi:helix-turn-helix transcriptional regulator [Phocaeicola coprocola]|uniref:helix-turn-helix transcriptional regulator n=1 Tax=Phocaeicola coprocola TaxID=310298 RepID=UPI00266EE30F|nr:LuxR C-terminal-related transcriptional regulator [Phocaeicola coprocola]
MQHIPEIAIVEQNTLTALGLQTILEELIPVATIRTFLSFARLIDDTPDMYSHYFVSAQTYFEHTSFFLARRPKTIVLAAGEQPSLSGIPTLNVCLPQDKLVKAIMQMRKQGHEATHHPVSPQEMQQEHDLSPREIEVLILITKGLINKEIADKLNISLTTVISHRKNITEKLGIKSVSGLAIYAVMHGYVEADRI